MMPLLLQSNDLPAFYEAMRKQFSQGGSVGKALLALAALASLLVFAHFLNRVERKVTVPAEPNDPQKLFRDLLPKLSLTLAQRQTLDTIVKDLKLRQPAVMLISETLFDNYLAQWRAQTGAPDPQHEEQLRRLKPRLFPTGVGWVASPPANP